MIKRALRAVLARGSTVYRLVHSRWIEWSHSGAVVERGVEVGAGCHVQVTDGGVLRIGAHTVIGRGVTLTAPAGRLHIGARTWVGQWSTLVATELIEIGEDCLIAERVTIRDQDHEIRGSSTVPIRCAGRTSCPVSIGSDVWIGAGAVILGGVTIGAGAVVGANAVVTRNVGPREIVVGVPARVLAMREDRSPAVNREPAH